jgi:ankyrin repeat protein
MRPLPPSCPDELQALLAGPNVNHIDHQGHHLLLRVVSTGDAALLRWYLERGPDLDVQNGLSKRTALVHAVYTDKPELATILVESGADVNVKSRYGETALLWAACKGEVERVELLLGRKARLVRTTGKFDRKNPLHMACDKQHLEVIRLLLAAGADVNVPTSRGETPLFCAASAHRATDEHTRETLELLLGHGAEVNAQAKGGYTALLWCALCSLRTSVELLLRHGANPGLQTEDGDTPLDVAKDPEVAALLKAAGAQARVPSDPVSLHKAIDDGDVEAFRAALDAGADPNAAKNRRPALLRAVGKNRGEMVRLLVERGCKLNARDWQRDGALHSVCGLRTALGSPNLDIGRFLIEAGIKIDLVNKHGQTPLTLSARRGDLEAMTLLLEHGANPNIVAGKSASTPLHHAAAVGQLEAARLLLRWDADKNALDKWARTPFDVARKRRNPIPELTNLLQPDD